MILKTILYVLGVLGIRSRELLGWRAIEEYGAKKHIVSIDNGEFDADFFIERVREEMEYGFVGKTENLAILDVVNHLEVLIVRNWALLEEVEILDEALGMKNKLLSRNLVMLAVAQDGFAIEFGGKWKSDMSVVMRAMHSNGCALRVLSDELRSDKEVVLAAVSGCGGAIAHTSLIDDPEVREAALSHDHSLQNLRLYYMAPELDAQEVLDMDDRVAISHRGDLIEPKDLIYIAKTNRLGEELPEMGAGASILLDRDPLLFTRDRKLLKFSASENPGMLRYCLGYLNDEEIIDVALDSEYFNNFMLEPIGDLVFSKYSGAVGVQHFSLDLFVGAIEQDWKAFRRCGYMRLVKKLAMSAVFLNPSNLSYYNTLIEFGSTREPSYFTEILKLAVTQFKSNNPEEELEYCLQRLENRPLDFDVVFYKNIDPSFAKFMIAEQKIWSLQEKRLLPLRSNYDVMLELIIYDAVKYEAYLSYSLIKYKKRMLAMAKIASLYKQFCASISPFLLLQKLKVHNKSKLELDRAYADEHFTCPISRAYYRDPVVIGSGRTYDRKSIDAYFANLRGANKPLRDPVTNAEIDSDLHFVITNWDKRSHIETFLSRTPNFHENDEIWELSPARESTLQNAPDYANIGGYDTWS